MNQKITMHVLLTCVLMFLAYIAKGQCSAGETELYLTIQTDNWGYETYWQITPTGSPCGDQMIAEGGNQIQVGCAGGGDQVANNTQGYNNNSEIVEGPICLTIGESYTLHYIDDYGDGGANFSFSLFGFPLFEFVGEGNGGTFEFEVIEPAPFDIEGHIVTTYGYLQPGANLISGHFFNAGSATIESLTINFLVDGVGLQTATVESLNISPFTYFELTHPTEWLSSDFGQYEVQLWCDMINGNMDANMDNDIVSKSITIGPGIPDMLEEYLGFVPLTEEIAGSSESILNPRDLDFHPTLTRNELWVVLKSTESSGGKTVKISNAGQSNQTTLLQQDGNAWHFMSLPTGIAFSQNENFATSPGVFDANHDGGTPFTGPSLWSSDPDVYAQESGGNGSHLDMLHESPYSMGIASEMDNKFWVTCGEHNEIMSYDFGEDHGPGNADHSDGIIYKYPIPGYNEDSNHEVPDHLVFDHGTGWLYVCNSQQNRVIRINTTTGIPGNDVAPHEPTAIYKYMSDFVWEEYISNDLNSPTGIDVLGNHLIVANYNSGDINLYDIGGESPVLLGIIPTGAPGIMGVKIGPDGHIWYVNSITDKVMRVSMQPVSVNEFAPLDNLVLYPNPANDVVMVNLKNVANPKDVVVQIIDLTGRVILQTKLSGPLSTVNTAELGNGIYEVIVYESKINVGSQKLLIVR